MSLTFSKLRAKLGLKPLEVNAVKKGEYGADDEGNEEVTKGSGVRTQVQHQLTAVCVRAHVCVCTHVAQSPTGMALLLMVIVGI